MCRVEYSDIDTYGRQAVTDSNRSDELEGLNRYVLDYVAGALPPRSPSTLLYGSEPLD